LIRLLDLSAPIFPGRGLAGLRVGRKVRRYGDLLFAAHQQYDGGPGQEAPDWCHFWMEPWAVRYRFGQVWGQTDEDFVAMADAMRAGDFDAADRYSKSPRDGFDANVEMYVDVRHGRIYMLRAVPGYQGTLGEVGVGMTVGEAMELEPRLRYDELRDELWLGDEQGVGFELSESDPPPEIVPTLRIEAIEVYAIRLTTRGGIRF
jgi:hypothetical protein